MPDTMQRGRTDAETCAINGWTVGTRLVGDEGYGPTVIQITAIGERSILAKTVSRDGIQADESFETTWTFTARDWTEVVDNG